MLRAFDVVCSTECITFFVVQRVFLFSSFSFSSFSFLDSVSLSLSQLLSVYGIFWSFEKKCECMRMFARRSSGIAMVTERYIEFSILMWRYSANAHTQGDRRQKRHTHTYKTIMAVKRSGVLTMKILQHSMWIQLNQKATKSTLKKMKEPGERERTSVSVIIAAVFIFNI